MVLDYLKTLAPTKQLSVKRLTLKMVTLLWLVTGQRGQSIQLIDLANLTVGEHSVKIRFGDLLKTTRPGFQQGEIKIKAYAPDRRPICELTSSKPSNYVLMTKRGSCLSVFRSLMPVSLRAQLPDGSRSLWPKRG